MEDKYLPFLLIAYYNIAINSFVKGLRANVKQKK
jgi:hypothetical protein